MTIREFIQLFRHLAEDKTGYVSDDTSYSDFAIYREASLVRSEMIKNLDGPGAFSDIMFQTLQCVMLEEVDANECGLIPDSGCKILKSTCAIPTALKLVSVSNQMGTESFDLIRWDKVSGKLNSRIESIKKGTFATIRNINGDSYLYLIGENIHQKNAVIVGIFEDVVQASRFCGNEEAMCNPLDTNFHTDYKITSMILKDLASIIFTTRNGSRIDILNNDNNLE